MSDEKFENYLREFEPKRPRALPTSEIVSPKWRRLAAAAIVLLCVGSTWLGLRERQSTQDLGATSNGSSDSNQTPWRTRTVLTNRALESPEKFEAALEKETKARFSRFGRQDGALQALAKE